MAENLTQENKVLPMLPKRPKQVTLSPDQQELLDIRNQLNMSQHVFADLIEIGRPRLRSYEQGKTESVPEHIMSQARELLKNKGQVSSDRYASMELSEIIAEWAHELNLDYDDDARLANFIGVNQEAIARWKSSNSRPAPLMLKQYREIVRDLKDRLETQQSPNTVKKRLTVVS